MKNNKGFTIVELIASFSLMMIVIVYLLRTIVVINNKNQELLVHQEYNVFASTLLNEINKDLKDKESSVEIISENNSIFIKGIDEYITFNKDENYITYKDTIYELPDGVALSDNPYTISKIEDDPIITNNNLFYIAKINFIINNKEEVLIISNTHYEDVTIKVEDDVTLSNSVKLGDYIKMTPTKVSYITDISKTGYTSTQTINPSELNVWRVIKINDDGTIEIVSENVSNVSVYFSGQVGYKNFVGYLNEIANQYQNENYTIKARHMGYNGQTEYLTDTANTVDSSVATAPWTCSTGESCNPVETKGGGDNLYTTDTNLVQNALGTLKANNPSDTATYSENH